MSLRTKYKDYKFDGERATRDDFALVDQAGIMSSLGGSTVGAMLGELTAIPAKYFLEVRKSDEVLAVMKFPYDPQSVQYNRPQPTTISYTLGGVVREANTVRRHNISMSGRSGLAFRMAYSRNGKLMYIAGEEVFQEFDEFFKRYQEICNQEFGMTQNLMPIIGRDRSAGSFAQMLTNGKDDVQMILRCLDEDLHLLVEPQNFSWSKDTQGNRFDYSWRCDFVAYGYATKFTNPFIAALTTFDNLLGSIGGAVGVVGNILDNVSNIYVGKVRDSIQNVAGTIRVAGDIANSLGGLINNTAGIASDIAAVVDSGIYIADSWDAAVGEESTAANFSDVWRRNLGPEIVRTEVVYQTTFTFQNNVSNMETLSQPLVVLDDDKGRDELGSVVAGVNSVINETENMKGHIPRKFHEIRQKKNKYNVRNLGEFLTNEENLSLFTKDIIDGPSPDEFMNRNGVYYVMRDDEDLSNVAQTFYRDPSKWRRIARANEFRDHRRRADGRFIQLGDKIFVPLDEVGNANPFGDEQDPIAIDLLLSEDGDLIIDSEGDILLAENEVNIEQLVKNILLTAEGELEGFTFGLSAIPQIGNEAYVATIIRESLERDVRIRSVSDIKVTYSDDAVIVDCKVHPIQSAPIPVRVPVA